MCWEVQNFLLTLHQDSCKISPLNWRKFVISPWNWSIQDIVNKLSRKASVWSTYKVIDPLSNSLSQVTALSVSEKGNNCNQIDYWEMFSMSKWMQMSMKFFKYMFVSSWAWPPNISFIWSKWSMVLVICKVSLPTIVGRWIAIAFLTSPKCSSSWNFPSKFAVSLPYFLILQCWLIFSPKEKKTTNNK